MADLLLSERRRYLEDLEIATYPTLDFGAPEVDYGKDAFVAAGSLVGFDNTVDRSNREDVLDSELLAQLAANKVANRDKEALKWYDKYRQVLENIGWVIQAFQFDGKRMDKSSFSMDDVVIKVLQSVVTGNGLAIVEAALAALKGTGEGSREVNIFETSSTSPNAGNFQVFPCYASDMGVAISFSGYEMRTTENVSHFLFWTFKSSTTTIQAAAETSVLNEAIYAKIRATVQAKLGKAAQDYVGGLDI
ncbi:MAG TPA: hypothetical protein VG455_09610 [Acidimicrobiales bacterium]|nr:hypothetical protein [Acidimicrobiales bacterium]